MFVHHPKLIKKGQTAFQEFGDQEVQAVATMRAVTKRQFFDNFLKAIAAKRTQN
jgi:hypothetical protein